jgi:hypothetical protein
MQGKRLRLQSTECNSLLLGLLGSGLGLIGLGLAALLVLLSAEIILDSLL